MGDRVPAGSVAVFGSETSIRPELTGLTLALEKCPVEENLTVLTDSKSSMELLQSMQRTSLCGSTGILLGNSCFMWTA